MKFVTRCCTTLVAGSLAVAMAGAQEIAQPPVKSSVDGMLSDTLTMAMSPITFGGTTIVSRLYNGISPGPTWRVRRGDTLRVLVKNQLPPNPDQDSADQGNYPQRVNTTNLHTHGLNVSPKDSSDNVLLTVLPGTDYQFRFELPDDHAAGTYWFHPHHHTSTYGQVVNGLAGTIIVEDVDDPEVTDPALLAIQDRIFMFSSFRYDTTTMTVPYPRRMASPTVFSPIPGIDSPVLINGQESGAVTFRPGEIQRWRCINATYMMNMEVVWLTIQDGDTSFIEQQKIAIDGLYLPAMQTITSDTIPTGSRSDFLVKAPNGPGEYVMALVTRNGDLEPIDVRSAIRMVVAGDPIDPPMTMPTWLPEPIAAGTIRDEEITGTRKLTFTVGPFDNIQSDPSVVTRAFAIDNSPFNHDVVNISVRAGSVEEWTIENASTDFHPFHIHVNEFQVVEKNGVKLDPPIWRDVLLLDTMSTYVIRHRFSDLDGKTVLHCHYLPHEDWGMMNIIEILPRTSSVDVAPWEMPQAFPNPVVGRIDRVNVRIPELLRGRSVRASLHDLTGTEVEATTLDVAAGGGLLSFDVADRAAGTYFIRVTDGGKYNESEMIVIVR